MSIEIVASTVLLTGGMVLKGGGPSPPEGFKVLATSIENYARLRDDFATCDIAMVGTYEKDTA